MAQNLQINWTAVHLACNASGMTRRQFWKTRLESFCPKGIPTLMYFYKRMTREKCLQQHAKDDRSASQESQSSNPKQERTAAASLPQVRQLGKNFQMVELDPTDLPQESPLPKASSWKSKSPTPLRMSFPNGIEISFSSAEPERFALQLASLLGGR